MYSIRKQYKTDKEKQILIEEFEGKGYRVTEIQNHIDGNFLVFSGRTEFHTMKDDKWEFNFDGYVDKKVRTERDNLLRGSDYMMLSDTFALLTEFEQNKLIAYRQQLRDLPATINNEATALNIVWPEK